MPQTIIKFKNGQMVMVHEAPADILRKVNKTGAAMILLSGKDGDVAVRASEILLVY